MKIGLLGGDAAQFAEVLAGRITSLRVPDLSAEVVHVGGVCAGTAAGYRVIADCSSVALPFYRSWLKHAAATGSIVVNNPFWHDAGDRMLTYAVAERIGVARPRAVMVPHKLTPADVADSALASLVYPLDWSSIFRLTGFPARLRCLHYGGAQTQWTVRDEREFFAAYDQTGTRLVMLEQQFPSASTLTVCVAGSERAHVSPECDRTLGARAVRDSLALSRALGCGLVCFEFAVEAGVPYLVDAAHPAHRPLAPEDREWLLNAAAEYLVSLALDTPSAVEHHWTHLLRSGSHLGSL